MAKEEVKEVKTVKPLKTVDESDYTDKKTTVRGIREGKLPKFGRLEHE